MVDVHRPTIGHVIREILREQGPLTLDELLALAGQRIPLTSKKPKGAIRTNLKSDLRYPRLADGRFDYLPRAVRGARVRVPITPSARTGEQLAMGVDAVTLLRAGHERHAKNVTSKLMLPDGTELAIDLNPSPNSPYSFGLGVDASVVLPRRFWDWWSAQRRQRADAIQIRCEDAEQDRFSVEPVRIAALDREAVEVANEVLRQTAIASVSKSRGVHSAMLAGQVLVSGAYHRDPPPDPWREVLFTPPTPIIFGRGFQIEYRPDMTPAMWRLFGHRVDPDLDEDDVMLDLFGSVLRKRKGKKRSAPKFKHLPVEHGYQLKVSLQWMPEVWRIIEIRGDETMESLHLEIQDAFGWDNDHMYSFYLSGRAWDNVTEVAIPSPYEYNPPMADELTLADLELRPKQRFLYLFDYGDELRHDVKVVKVIPLDAASAEPRIVETHGEAPAQYRKWDDEDDDEDTEIDEEDGENEVTRGL